MALPWSHLTPRANGDFECLSDRATDYYGLGVRLGIYFAWLGSYIANTLLPSEFSGAADTSAIFLLTLLIAMTNDSRTHELTQIDGLTLMHLCGGTVFGVLSIWGYRTRCYSDHGPKAVRQFGGFGTHLRLAISLGVSLYGCWFWLHGVTNSLIPLGPDDGADPPNPSECATLYTFFFAKLRADGGIRFYYAVVCVLCCLWFGTMFLVSSLAGVASFRRWRSVEEFNRWGTSNRGRYATGFTHKELKYMYQFLRIGNLIWLLWSAVTVEVTLNFNHVRGVLGATPNDGNLHLPSQLLPFLVGLFSFLRTLYILVKEKLGRSRERRKLAAHAKKSDDTASVIEAAVLVVPEDQLPPKDESAANTPLPRADSYKIIARSLPVRYLVGWLPWLGLVVHPETKSKSKISNIIEKGAGLMVVSPEVMDPAYRAGQEQWSAEHTENSAKAGDARSPV